MAPSQVGWLSLMWCDLNRDLCKVWITIIDHVHCSVYNVISNYLVLLLCHVQLQGGASGQCELNRNLCKDWIIIIDHVHCPVYNVISNYLGVLLCHVQHQGVDSGQCALNRNLCKDWIIIIGNVHCSVYNVISPPAPAAATVGPHGKKTAGSQLCHTPFMMFDTGAWMLTVA